MLSQEIIQAAREVPPTDNWRLRHEKLSEEELREIIRNNSDINWVSISWRQKLSEDFIREFKNYVNWYSISRHQNLSEKFIIEFKDYVNWYVILREQNLSPEFIKRYSHLVKEYNNLLFISY